MSVFPDMPYNPDVTLKESLEDSTIRSRTESGYEITRRRYSRTRRVWEVSYSFVPQSFKDSLYVFINEEVKEGALPFTWTHPTTQETFEVRFSELPEFAYAGQANFGDGEGSVTTYNFSFKMRQV